MAQSTKHSDWLYGIEHSYDVASAAMCYNIAVTHGHVQQVWRGLVIPGFVLQNVRPGRWNPPGRFWQDSKLEGSAFHMSGA